MSKYPLLYDTNSHPQYHHDAAALSNMYYYSVTLHIETLHFDVFDNQSLISLISDW